LTYTRLNEHSCVTTIIESISYDYTHTCTCIQFNMGSIGKSNTCTLELHAARASRVRVGAVGNVENRQIRCSEAFWARLGETWISSITKQYIWLVCGCSWAVLSPPGLELTHLRESDHRNQRICIHDYSLDIKSPMTAIVRSNSAPAHYVGTDRIDHTYPKCRTKAFDRVIVF
jgi:hypothetical protein